jgi:hypothetical protein
MARAGTARFALAACFVLIPTLIFGQAGAGSIAGAVKDAIGAVLWRARAELEFELRQAHRVGSQ